MLKRYHFNDSWRRTPHLCHLRNRSRVSRTAPSLLCASSTSLTPLLNSCSPAELERPLKASGIGIVVQRGGVGGSCEDMLVDKYVGPGNRFSKPIEMVLLFSNNTRQSYRTPLVNGQHERVWQLHPRDRITTNNTMEMLQKKKRRDIIN